MGVFSLIAEITFCTSPLDHLDEHCGLQEHSVHKTLFTNSCKSSCDGDCFFELLLLLLFGVVLAEVLLRECGEALLLFMGKKIFLFFLTLSKTGNYGNYHHCSSTKKRILLQLLLHCHTLCLL